MPRKRKEIIRLIEQATAQKIAVLDLSNCDLRDLIDEVCRMDWVTELTLARCHLDVLPEAIGNLHQLTRLVLSDNQLATLPESVCRLSAMQYINLHSNSYKFEVSVPVRKWLTNVPEVIWTDGKPFDYEPPKPFLLEGDHPNLWLSVLKSALALYGTALAMEDRGYGGYDKREEADARITQIFKEEPELAIIFPDFYRDFLAHGFYSFNKESEKTIDGNPFYLPTTADEKWLAENATATNAPPPFSLRAERRDSRCRVFAVNDHTGLQSEVFSCSYGTTPVSNYPYAADEEYFGDGAGRIYRAGQERFYVYAEVYGYGGGLYPDWYGSDDGGQTWRKQARLTYKWLKNFVRDRQIGDLLPASQES